MDNLENSFLDIKKLFLYYFIYTAQAKFSKIAGPAPPDREYVTLVPLKLTFWLMPKLYIHLRKMSIVIGNSFDCRGRHIIARQKLFSCCWMFGHVSFEISRLST